jgi:hypothetical protein
MGEELGHAGETDSALDLVDMDVQARAHALA